MPSACCTPHPQSAVFLIEMGADLTVTDPEGLTPLELLNRPHPNHAHMPSAHNPTDPYSVEGLMKAGRLQQQSRLRNYAAGAMPSSLDTYEAIRAVSPSEWPQPRLPALYEARPWSPRVHRFFPCDFRQVVRMLLCHARRGPPDGSEAASSASLPVDMWVLILSHTHRDWLFMGRPGVKLPEVYRGNPNPAPLPP